MNNNTRSTLNPHVDVSGKSIQPEYFSDPELSARWALKAGTLRNWRCQGRGPNFTKFGGSVRYIIADILAYEDDSARVIGDVA